MSSLRNVIGLNAHMATAERETVSGWVRKEFIEFVNNNKIFTSTGFKSTVKVTQILRGKIALV